MKKSAVPDTQGVPTPEWVRAVTDNINVFAGRKKNSKVTLPTIQAPTFSSPPTQAECQALVAYLNEWAKAMKALTARFDE